MSNTVLANLMVCPKNSQKGSLPHKEASQIYPYQNFVSLGFLPPLQAGRGKNVILTSSLQKGKRRKKHTLLTPLRYLQYLFLEQAQNWGCARRQPCGTAKLRLSKPMSLNPEVWLNSSIAQGQQEPAQGPIHSAFHCLQTGSFCVILSEMPPKSSSGS